jgi:trimeric autotransporter adhesin
MANTTIQLKWSEVTSTPVSLNVAEPAYSNVSGKFFIGGEDQTPILIGGKYYVDIVDAATSANVSNTIVKRDTDGAFSASVVKADLFGNANTTTQLKTARWFNFSGDVDPIAVSFDGTSNADFTLELTNTGVTAGTYGGSKVPVFTVDEDGRITNAANVDIATSLSIAADTGANVVALLTDTITFVGGDGITTTIDPTNNVKIDVDHTVLRNDGDQSIDGNLAITGNLIVTGTEIIQDVATIRTEDTLIELAANNAADALDIGFFGTYVNDGTKYTAFYRDASDAGKFKLLVGGTEKPSAANTVNAAAFQRATLDANLTGGIVSGLSAAIAIVDGGTNATGFSTGNLVFFNGTSLASVANTGVAAGTYGGVDRTQTIQVDDYGCVVSVTNNAIAIDTSQITSGILPLARGGTNSDGTFTTGAAIQFDGSKLVSLANTGVAGTYANASHVPVITTDAYGRVSSVVNTAIAIDVTQITSGTLPVNRGGTGSASFSTKGVIVSDNASGTGALTALTSATEGHVLQINGSGVPTFAHLNGGSF